MFGQCFANTLAMFCQCLKGNPPRCKAADPPPRYFESDVRDGRGFMVYVECTGRMHAVLHVLRCVCASSVRILGKSPHFICQRLGRSAGYPQVLDALCTPELWYSLFACRPFEEFGMASMKVETTRCGVRVYIRDDVRLQCSCSGLRRILLGIGLPENCWCFVWS